MIIIIMIIIGYLLEILSQGILVGIILRALRASGRARCYAAVPCYRLQGPLPLAVTPATGVTVEINTKPS